MTGYSGSDLTVNFDLGPSATASVAWQRELASGI